MAEDLNLIQKLAKIREIADVVAKDKKGYNYSYADITSILAKVTAGMNKYGVSLVPIINRGTASVSQTVSVNTKTDRTGKTYDSTTTEMLVTAEMTFRWVNNDDVCDTMDVPWFITGSQGDPSQALGSALTYCTRYFLTSFFQIAQADNDVDAYRSKQKEAEASEEIAVAGEIVSSFDTLLRTYLADHPDSSEEVKKFISRYAKKGNYLGIKNPEIAAKLVEDFKATYLNQKEE